MKPSKNSRPTNKIASSAYRLGEGNNKDLSKLKDKKADHTNLNLQGFDLSNKELGGLDLSGSDLRNCIISDTSFYKSNINQVDFRGSIFNKPPRLFGAIFDSITIDSLLADLLAEGYRSDMVALMPTDLVKIRVSDPVVELKRAFLGYKKVIHMIAVMMFVLPYLIFLIHCWINSKMNSSNGDEITVADAMARYIYNGGLYLNEGYRFNFSFILFMFSITYIFVRSLLLWKASSLEMEKQLTGFPSQFSLTGGWYYLFYGAVFGFWINLFVIGYNIIHLLNARVIILE